MGLLERSDHVGPAREADEHQGPGDDPEGDDGDEVEAEEAKDESVDGHGLGQGHGENIGREEEGHPLRHDRVRIGESPQRRDLIPKHPLRVRVWHLFDLEGRRSGGLPLRVSRPGDAGDRRERPRDRERKLIKKIVAALDLIDRLDRPAVVSSALDSSVGLVAGVASGMFGIGGGAVIVPALVVLLKFDQKLAVGTSLGALLGPVGVPAVLNFSNEGVLNLEIGLLVAVGLLFGAIFGARIALGLPSKTIKRMYGVFLLLVALRFILG